MTILEEYNWLEQNDKENYDRYLELFSADSTNDSCLISYFYPFFVRLFNYEGYKRIKEMYVIAGNYYSLNPGYKDAYQLLYILIDYCYSVGDYVQVFLLISKFDKETTPPDFLIGAYCNQINIMVSLNMFEEAYDCVVEIFDEPYFISASSYSKALFYLNAIPLTLKKKDVLKTRRYLDLLNILLDEKNFLGDCRFIVTSIIEFYADFVLVSDGFVEEDMGHLCDEFYDFIMNNTLTTQIVTYDSDTFITIFDLGKEYFDDKRLFDICMKIIKDTSPVHRDLLAFYNYLYNAKNKYFIDDPELKEKYLNALYTNYVNSSKNNSNILKETLRLQLLERKYNVLEAKFNFDTLTNCFNRNHLLEIEDNLINKGSICYIDLDYLKRINDMFGHKSGDIYLKIFSSMLIKAFKTGLNQIFRFGGDEFVIITHGETKESVLQRIDNLFEVAKNTTMPNVGLETIGFSCGVYFVEKETVIKDAIALADKAMYRCKNQRKTDEECHYVIYE